MWQRLQLHFNRLRYSLTSRLLFLFLIIALLLTSLILFTVFSGIKHHFHTQVRPMMVHYIDLIADDIGTPPNLQKAVEMTQGIPLNIHIVHNGQTWSTDGSHIPAHQLEKKFKKRPPKIKYKQFYETPSRPLWLNGTAHRLRISEDELLFHLTKEDYDFYFEISRSRSQRIAMNILSFLGAALLGSFFIVLFTAYRILKPIKDIDTGVNAFARGDFSNRIRKSYDDQLGHLTDSVNSMADEIENMLESKRQLLLGMSHELRSPIARSKVNLALMPEGKQTDALHRDMEVMENLITELLESERLNSKHAVLNHSQFDLSQLINDMLTTDFAGKHITADLIHCQITADAARIKLMLRNIINNALTHSGDNAPPEISLRQQHDTCEIKVTDHGHGIAAEHITHLTDPFYRADPSRQRKTGGYGLGLYLCRMIAQAHNGQLDIQSEVGKGTSIIIQLPLQQSV